MTISYEHKESNLQKLFENLYTYNFRDKDGVDKLLLTVSDYSETVNPDNRTIKCKFQLNIEDRNDNTKTKQELSFIVPADDNELVTVDDKYRVQISSARRSPVCDFWPQTISLRPYLFHIKKDTVSWSAFSTERISFLSLCLYFDLLDKYFPEYKGGKGVKQLTQEEINIINGTELSQDSLDKIELISRGKYKFASKVLTRDLLDTLLMIHNDPDLTREYNEDTPFDYQYMTALDGLAYEINEQRYKFRRFMAFDYNARNKKISTTRVQQVIDHYFKLQAENFRDVQVPKESNAVAMLAQSKKLYFYERKPKENNAAEKEWVKRRIWNNYFVGVLDAAKTAEGPLTSQNNEMTLDTRIEKNRILIKVLTKAFKEVEIDYAEYMRSGVLLYDYIDYANQVIHPIDGEYTYMKYGKFETTKNDGDFKYLRTHNNRLSPTTACLPFLDRMAPTRAGLASHFFDQSIPVVGAKPPAIATSANKAYYKTSPYNTRSTVDGEVVAVKDGFVKVKMANGKTKVFGDGKEYRNTGEHTTNRFTATVTEGQKVKAGDTLISMNSFIDGEFSTSVPMYAAFMTYEGYDQEDGIVLTESAARKFTHVEIQDFVLRPTYNVSFIKPLDTARFNEFSIIKVGQPVKAGDVLFSYYEYPDAKDQDVRLAANIMTDLSLSGNQVRRLREHKAPLDINEHGTVVKVRVHLNTLGSKVMDDSVKAFIEYYTQENMKLDLDYQELTGKRQAEYTFRDDQDLFHVIVTIEYLNTMERNRLSGKVTNYYGSKGVNTYLIPDDLAPVDEFGNKIECILSPVSLYSRMNPCQADEAKLGLVCLEAAKYIKKHGMKDQKSQEIFKMLYPEGSRTEAEVESDVEKYGYCRVMVDPFDRFYSMNRIKMLLELLGLGNGNAKVYLPNYKRWTTLPCTVGLISMIRLHFIQEKKAKATSDETFETDEDNIVYSGTDKKGGQKIGAQEVWALMAHGQQEVLGELQQTYDKKEARFESALLMLGLRLKVDQPEQDGSRK